VARALSLAPSDEDVRVTLHPADLAALGAEGTTRTEGGRAITFAADDTLAPGDALARSGATSIDARLGAALERVREVLAP
jgi:flagellar assembly protein FliH